MRLRVGHRPSDWLELGPGYGGSVKLGGELVVAASNWRERARKKAARQAPPPEPES